MFKAIRQYIIQIMSSSPLPKAYVRRDNGANMFHLTFKLNLRDFNLNRRATESVGDLISRIKGSVEKTVVKKSRKKKNLAEAKSVALEIPVSVIKDGSEVDSSQICEEVFFSSSKILRLFVLDTQYEVVVNAPLVFKLSLPSVALVDCLFFPSKIIIKHGYVEDSLFRWYVAEDLAGTQWKLVGEDFFYIPKVNDIGKRVKLECVPGDRSVLGPSHTVFSTRSVEAHPGLCPFITRQAFTRDSLSWPKFRVISYNILASRYAETEAANNELYPYCPPYARSWDYRRPLLLQEILGYKANILCLQEVDAKAYDFDLGFVLKKKGYEGVFTRKQGNIDEGVATFYDANQYSLFESHTISLGQDIDSEPIFSNIWNKIKDNPTLSERVLNLPTVAQVSILKAKSSPNDLLIVGNTHLYFHPDSDHIRLLQSGLLMIYIEDLVARFQNRDPDKRISLVICGDFNSTPDCGIYKLITDNDVTSDCIDWKSKEGEEIENLHLKQPFCFSSACGTPPFTNFTVGFSACLDYIFYSTQHLTLDQVVPLPSEEELRSHTALPSVLFPSDHVALVADFLCKD